MALFAILVSIGPVRAEGVPPHLASLAAQLYRDNATALEDPLQDPEHAEAAKRALDMLRRAGIRHWARNPVLMPGAAEAVATALGLDLASAADRAEIDRLLALDSQAAAAAIAERIRAAGGDEAAINDAVTAVAAARMPPETLATQHLIELDRGETVELQWDPQSGEFTIEAADDGSGGDKPFNSVLLGETAFAADPETGDMTTTIAPAETPARTYTERDFERIRASIFGEWRDQDDAIWTIAPVGEDTGLGEIQRSPAAIDAEIEALEAQIDEIQKAKEFVWQDPTTGEIIRQQRFRRLDLPWEFVGEEALVPNAEQEVAERREQIAALEAEKSGTSLPPVQQYDPAGFGAAQKAAGAVPVAIEVAQADGYRYRWDEALFDGKRITARRTFRDIRDYNKQLPETIMQQLIAGWSPPGWVELEAVLDVATAVVTLSGDQWSLHVTYGGDMFGENLTVESIHTPYASDLSMSRSGSAEHVAWGAPDDALP
ncbi:MAG: hypothetical protein SGJ07_12895 [Rhodospirillaceae bacterium]|nr:hypothetical protein [Rhodospirillaceae bacterium]